MFHIADTEKIRLKLIGVSCAACISPIRKNLEKEKGVRNVGANYITDSIIVDYDPNLTNRMKIIQIINKLGYKSMEMQ